MDCVLAKIKGKGKNKLVKLISDQSLFLDILIPLEKCVDYNPDHNLDEDSWFKIDNFGEQPYCNVDFIKSDFISGEYDSLQKSKFSEIRYLCSVQSTYFCFQRISRSSFVAKKLIAFGESAYLEEGTTRIVVNSYPDAIYDQKGDRLIFRSLAAIASIFRGVDVLYREATKEEVRRFLSEPFLLLNSEFSDSDVSKPNRKRIGLALDTLKKLPEDRRIDMIQYIGDYAKQLKISDDRLSVEISTDEELKLLLYGIEQRFYTTPFGLEKRLANSVLNL